MPDAYTVALTLLAVRDLSEAQIRARLTRRALDAGDIDAAIARLVQDGTLNDRRVALAAARMESAIRHRGRARVLQKVRQMGIDSRTAESAVGEIFDEVDERALLDHALARRLRGRAPGDLDDKGRARIIRALAAQGFAIDAILERLRFPPDPPSR